MSSSPEVLELLDEGKIRGQIQAVLRHDTKSFEDLLKDLNTLLTRANINTDLSGALGMIKNLGFPDQVKDRNGSGETATLSILNRNKFEESILFNGDDFYYVK